MDILIAEDDSISRRLLEATLTRAGYDVVATEDGAAAWDVLRDPDAPRLAIIDWMMPEMDGLEVCSRVRARPSGGYVYILLLTAKGETQDIVAGLEAGADDYLVKPFHPQELRARIMVGRRLLDLESRLAGKVDELQQALDHVGRLQGLLPICMYCKKIRDDRDTWHRLESYIEEQSEATFTHSLCDDCRDTHYPGIARGTATTASGDD